MIAYMIAQIRIDDPERYQDYLAGFMPIFQRHDGELLTVSSKDVETLEGEWALGQVVLMKFPTLEAAKEWHADPDYQQLAQHRHASAEANLILVEGVN